MKLTRELVRQIESHFADARDSLIEASLAAGPNTQGYALYRDDAVRAATTTNPNAGWARFASGLNQQPAERVRRAIRFFEEHRTPARARIIPDGFTAAQADVLGEMGLRHTGFHTMLFAPLAVLVPRHPVADIRLARSPEQIDDHIDIQLGTYNVPAAAIDAVRALRRAWWTLPDHRFYLAYVDGRPAAQAMLFCRDGIGYLESAGTLAAYRNRGLQTALIHRRMADAAAMGCRLIYGAADFENNSRTNQMAAGLQVAYTAAWWDQRPSNQETT